MVTREICKCCGRENPLGFTVPDDVWERAVPEPYKNRVLCIMCFDHFATAAGVDWTATPVEFYPVSGVSFARSEGQPIEAVAARTAPNKTLLPEKVAERVLRRVRDALWDQCNAMRDSGLRGAGLGAATQFLAGVHKRLRLPDRPDGDYGPAVAVALNGGADEQAGAAQGQGEGECGE